MKQAFVTLNNGNKIPAVAIIGTGTEWYKKPGQENVISQELIDQLKYALTLPGVIHIDAAEAYNTYVEIGRALQESSKPRDQIFVTDKYSPVPKSGRTITESFARSLELTGLEYIDLYLIHWPFIDKDRDGFGLADVWRDLEALYRSGKVRNIGVSNFSTQDLQTILQSGTVKPQVHQIEFHAFLQDQTPGIVEFCQKNDIQLSAYSPLAPLQRRGSAQDPFYDYLLELATRYQRTEALILLRWVTRRHVIPITTSSKPARVRAAQLELFEFDLTADEVDRLTRLGAEHGALRLYWTDVYSIYDRPRK